MTRNLSPALSEALRWYYLGPDHPMKIRLWQRLRRLFKYRRLTVRYGGGWITVDERDLVDGRVFVYGHYEPEVWDRLMEFASTDEVVWDVGAHIGSFAVRAMLDGRIRAVHAFEPDPITAEILDYNLRLNGTKAIAHRLALSDRPEKRTIRHGPQANTGLSTLDSPSVPMGTHFEVDCLPADEVVARGQAPPPTLMKVDVEGWERRVLAGAKCLLTHERPKAIVLEAECTDSGELADKEIASYLGSLGYSLSRIQRPEGISESRENFLAVAWK